MGQTSQRLAGPNTVYSCINKYRFIHFVVKSPLNTEKRPRYSNNWHTREDNNLFGSKLHWLPGVSIVSGARQRRSHGSTDASILRVRIERCRAHQQGGRGCQQTSQPVESHVADAVLTGDRRRLLMLSLGRK